MYCAKEVSQAVSMCPSSVIHKKKSDGLADHSMYSSDSVRQTQLTDAYTRHKPALDLETG